MKETMTIEAAEKIITAFGPCTTVYECSTAKDLVSQYEEFSCETVNDFIKILLKCEDVFEERTAESVYEEDAGCYGDGRHAKYVEESKKFRAELKERLKANGFV